MSKIQPAQVRASAVDDVDPAADGGRGAVLVGAATSTEWLVWDWTRQCDERLDTISVDVYDVAEQTHRLATLVIAAFFTFAAMLAVLIGVMIV